VTKNCPVLGPGADRIGMCQRDVIIVGRRDITVEIVLQESNMKDEM